MDDLVAREEQAQDEDETEKRKRLLETIPKESEGPSEEVWKLEALISHLTSRLFLTMSYWLFSCQWNILSKSFKVAHQCHIRKQESSMMTPNYNCARLGSWWNSSPFCRQHKLIILYSHSYIFIFGRDGAWGFLVSYSKLIKDIFFLCDGCSFFFLPRKMKK